ncbi:hypothetical protein PAEVO_31370 [Paenibacillus sp. GM2FR]|uniref:hypothetical protein n=1 Tax=Paenibacillus sp. GM2FR TaxID=2059268 RepID=UPI000C27BB62|nr:hypothetical protein [Paenibacillus sp. GM2FR]PJN56414.1 hypothetical protein PAEVO_31370 [Paenibacillus sp. GM2FR]
MKKVVAGGFLLISGIILYLSVHIPATLFASKLGSWTTPPGRLGTALAEMGAVAAINGSIILIISGVVVILWGAFEDELIRLYKYSKRRSDIEKSANEHIH